MWKTGRTRPASISRRLRPGRRRTDEGHMPRALDRLAAARLASGALVRHAQPPIQHALRRWFPRLRPSVQIWPRRLELGQRDDLRLRHDAELDVLDRLGRIILAASQSWDRMTEAARRELRSTACAPPSLTNAREQRASAARPAAEACPCRPPAASRRRLQAPSRSSGRKQARNRRQNATSERKSKSIGGARGRRRPGPRRPTPR